MTLLFADQALFTRHDTGRGHPERPQRLVAIHKALDEAGLAARCTPGAFGPLSPEALLAAHAPPVIEAARRVAEAGGGFLDGDTPVCPESYHVARAAAGAGCAAVDAVLDGTDTTALCLVRPPGHHATPVRSMGFCLFNTVALAARRAVARGLSRVLVVDFDVHHGNGTQDIFYDDGRVTFLSIHRYGHGFYPGTGDADETGEGRGLGHIVNVPLPHATPRREYHAAFAAAVDRAASVSRPELVLISAGFDAHRDDPIGGLGLEVEDYSTLTKLLLDVARAHASSRVVSCLEGGYHLDALAAGVAAHLQALLEGRGA